MILNKEELDFLVDLGHELKTQDNLATRKPVVWRIQNLVKIPISISVDDPDIFRIIIDGDYYEWKCNELPNTMTKVIDEISVNYPEVDEDHWAVVMEMAEDFDGSYLSFEEIVAELDDIIPEDVEGIYLVERYEFLDHEYFLTERAAREWMDRRMYKLNKPRLYCDCSSETPELERLLEIVEKISEHANEE